MAVDIGSLLDFTGDRNDIEHPTKVRIENILDTPVTVVKWVTIPSKFTDNPTGVFAKITVKTEDNIFYVFNTGSNIVLEQLGSIAKNNPEVKEFTCIFKTIGLYTKMFPVTTGVK